jgi:hypothetical protein
LNRPNRNGKLERAFRFFCVRAADACRRANRTPTVFSIAATKSAKPSADKKNLIKIFFYFVKSLTCDVAFNKIKIVGETRRFVGSIFILSASSLYA